MVTRQEAENQTDRCFMYHLGSYAGALAILTAVDRRAVPWVAGVWGLGVALHGALLYGCDHSRESLVRTTASLMEDLRHKAIPSSDPEQSLATVAEPTVAPFHW